MRENTKWIFYILVAAFVAWLVVDVGAGITGTGGFGTGDVVVKVNGDPIRLQEYQAAYQNSLEQIRQQNRSGPLTREDEQALQDQVVEQLIQNRLMTQAYERLGLYATEQEIQEAAQSSPPPELMQLAQFQTDGQFDPAKWQRFLSRGADPQFLLALEARYRDEIPRVKLAQYLTADVYVSDAKLWRIYRDQHDTVTAVVVAMWPSTVPDSEVRVSDADLQRYLDEHEEEFKRPAVAHLSYVVEPRVPSAQDSAASRERAASVRAEAARGGAENFIEVAKRESADSGSAPEGGDLGWLKASTPGLDQTFAQAMRRLKPGQVSAPVATQFGMHIIRVEAARGDSMHVRHILVPFDLRPERRDTVEARADSMDRIAANQTLGSMLDTASRLLGVPVSRAPRLFEGDRMQLGRYPVPDVSIWAFEARVGETSPVIEGPAGFYVFRLDSLVPEGVPPVADVRDALTMQVRAEKKKAALGSRAPQVLGEVRGASDLTSAATARGLAAQSWGPMTRLQPPGYLGREPLVLGAAFGLDVGERSPVIDGEEGYYLVQVTKRRSADSTAWVAQRDAQREQLLQTARQARIRAYLDALRASAEVQDRRKELFRAPTLDERATS